jgi:ferredoxin
MSGGDGNDRERGGTDGGLTRRRLFGLGAAAVAVGGAAAFGSFRAGHGAAAGGSRLVVSEECLGCTGCVVVCPEAALLLEPGCRIAVIDERCTRCGYCVAACPVDALRVGREAGRA